MNTNFKTVMRCKNSQGKHKRGPTSYKMHDSNLVFETLRLKNGDVFLDMGCGPGDYSVHAAKIVGCKGTIYALDGNIKMLKEVEKQADENKITNIKTIYGEISGVLPFEDKSIDTCFMSTSLHCIDLNELGDTIFKEVERVLKYSGQIAIIECKKDNADFGPPLNIRISTEEIKSVTQPLGFCEAAYLDLGFNYMIILKK